MKQITILFALVIFVGITTKAQSYIKKETKMKVAVWDSYVTKTNGIIMHFDILVPVEIKDQSVVYNYGKEYLKSKGQGSQEFTAKECSFCHVEVLKPSWEIDILLKEYIIVELDNCE